MTSLDLVLDVEIPHLHAQINGHHQPLNPHRIGGLDPLHKYVSNRIISPRGEMKDLRNHHTVMYVAETLRHIMIRGAKILPNPTHIAYL